MQRALIATMLVGVTTACGPGLPEKPVGPPPCDLAEAQLRKRVGPELGLVVAKQPLPLPTPSADGCALVYTLVGEEMIGEVAGESTPDAAGDHQLAIALPGAAGQSMNLMQPSKGAPAEITMQLKLQDVNASGQMELVVQEDKGFGSDGFRGLQLFDYARGDGLPHPIFSERLAITTPEGLVLIPEWKTGSVGGKRAVFLDGAGTIRVWTWDGATRRFVFDEAETQKRAPKPKPKPAAPPPEVGGADAEGGDATPAADAKGTDDEKAKDDEKAEKQPDPKAKKKAKPGKKPLPPLDLDGL